MINLLSDTVEHNGTIYVTAAARDRLMVQRGQLVQRLSGGIVDLELARQVRMIDVLMALPVWGG